MRPGARRDPPPDAGSIVVGVVSTAKYYAPMALGAFRRTHPDIELKLVVGNRSDIIAGLIGLTLDLAIMGRPPAELDADTMVIGDHPHIMIAPPDHPLAAERGLSPARLSGEAFLVREVGSGTRGLMSRLFEEAGVPHPRIAMEIGSNETVKQAVMAGSGSPSSPPTRWPPKSPTAGSRCSTSPVCRWCGNGSRCATATSA